LKCQELALSGKPWLELDVSVVVSVCGTISVETLNNVVFVVLICVKVLFTD
jgi:hypothetical protein